jgi:hypothetical protein
MTVVGKRSNFAMLTDMTNPERVFGEKLTADPAEGKADARARGSRRSNASA